eukprot:2578454-Pyramimonas_sp.AAC.1
MLLLVGSVASEPVFNLRPCRVAAFQLGVLLSAVARFPWEQALHEPRGIFHGALQLSGDVDR